MRRRAAIVISVFVVVAQGLAVNPANAQRVGAAEWANPDRVEGCTSTPRTPILDPYARTSDWNCSIDFEAADLDCTVVNPTGATFTGCSASLKIDFTGTAVREKTDDGRRVWQCEGSQTDAEFQFYDGRSGRTFGAYAQVEVHATQEQLTPDGQGTVTVSTGEYNGSLIYDAGLGTLHFSGTFSIECSGAGGRPAQGYDYVGSLLLVEA